MFLVGCRFFNKGKQMPSQADLSCKSFNVNLFGIISNDVSSMGFMHRMNGDWKRVERGAGNPLLVKQLTHQTNLFKTISLSNNDALKVLIYKKPQGRMMYVDNMKHADKI